MPVERTLVGYNAAGESGAGPVNSSMTAPIRHWQKISVVASGALKPVTGRGWL